MITDINCWRELRASDELKNKTIGFVPTMGNLHAGHASLLSRSVAENDVTILSIFVNPTQFNRPEDLTNYPRTPDQDIQLAGQVDVDIVLMPTDEDLYPDHYRYKVSENQLSTMMEGAYRPGHFEGMLTVVLKFLLLVKPTHAYFGEKDYQQLQLIKGMVSAFFLDVKIIPCKTVRNDQGLALSSRNSRLTHQQLKFAEKFSELLRSNQTCKVIQRKLTETGFKVDYITEYQGRRFGAVFVGNIRLIDNIEMKEKIKC